MFICTTYSGLAGADEDLGYVPSRLPAVVPMINPDKAITRRKAINLTAAEFKKEFWKTDTPVVITGLLL